MSLLYKSMCVLCPRKGNLTLLILQCFTSLATYFLVYIAQLITRSVHWDISENLFNELDIQLAVNLKSLGVLVLALWWKWSQLIMSCDWGIIGIKGIGSCSTLLMMCCACLEAFYNSNAENKTKNPNAVYRSKFNNNCFVLFNCYTFSSH